MVIVKLFTQSRRQSIVGNIDNNYIFIVIVTLSLLYYYVLNDISTFDCCISHDPARILFWSFEN